MGWIQDEPDRVAAKAREILGDIDDPIAVAQAHSDWVDSVVAKHYHRVQILRIALIAITIAVVLALALILTGCSAPESGRVADGKYYPAYNEYHAGSTSCTGTPSRCTTTPGWTQFHPESWRLRLIDGKGEDGWRSVDETTFHRCNINEHFPECASDQVGDAR